MRDTAGYAFFSFSARFVGALWIGASLAGGCASDPAAAECVSQEDCGGALCVDGQCEPLGDAGPVCTGSEALCGGTCVDLETNVNHCGACGSSCSAGASCRAGVCGDRCDDALSLCESECVNTLTDPENCGTCGTECTAAEMCAEGGCVASCDPTDPPAEICDGVDNDCDGTTDAVDCDAEGLLAWYSFDAAEAPAVDISGRGFDAVVEGEAQYVAEGRFGGALATDGAVPSRAIVNDVEGLGLVSAMTVEAWVRPDACATEGSGFNPIATIERTLLLGFGNNCRVQNFVFTGGEYRSNAPLATVGVGVWNHVAMTWDGAELRSYLNGRPVGEPTVTAGVLGTPGLPLQIGSRTNCGSGCAQAFRGRIDDVQFWSRVFSPEEVCAAAGGRVTDALGCVLAP